MEMFNMDILTSLHDPDQRATFSQDVTTDADKFEKILTPLEHRINKVSQSQSRCEHALCYSCRRPMQIGLFQTL